ncbi:MAG: hypothetical protein KC931_27920, partial [Candidatus Omnitrophica bacterium]|nr:hypothetical protein [Candidatus Omnitrophota bacterium]
MTRVEAGWPRWGVESLASARDRELPDKGDPTSRGVSVWRDTFHCVRACISEGLISSTPLSGPHPRGLGPQSAKADFAQREVSNLTY